jgi:hypothetical protein
MKPAFCTGSLLASSNGERIYAPGKILVTEAMRGCVRTFGNANDVSKRYTGIKLHFFQGIIIALFRH